MNNLRTYIFAAIATLLLASCAKSIETGPNAAAIRYLYAWKSQNPEWADADSTRLGAYYNDIVVGSGKEVTNNGFAILRYQASDLSGEISDYTDKETAKMLGKYDTTSYYGPKVLCTKEGTLQAGLRDALNGMKVGGRRKMLVPNWLMTYSVYSDKEEYKKHATDYPNALYDITVVDFAEDVDKWQISEIEKYITDKYGDVKSFTSDTVGFYYKSLTPDKITDKKDKTNGSAFPGDTTIYINYTGMLLNGLVFDTSIEKVAKDNGIYSSSRTYSPKKVNWANKPEEITLDGSAVVPGFSRTLWQMHPLETGIGIFYSNLGYGYSGNGNSIPSYSPLIFRIEIVKDPNK